jgi:hypothetical protein
MYRYDHFIPTLITNNFHVENIEINKGNHRCLSSVAADRDGRYTAAFL